MPKTFTNYEIATVVEVLYSELQVAETSRGAWAYSLYYVLMNCFVRKIPAPAWEESYHQWNIDHLYRGALASKRKQTLIPVCSIRNCKRVGQNVLIQGVLKDAGAKQFEVSIRKEHFNALFAAQLNGEHLFILETEVDEIITVLGEISRKENKQEQNDKIDALWKLINETRKIYKDAGKIEKEYFETVIGAAIFYLPHPVNECFNGFCSLNALDDDLKGKHVVKEHLYPRKRAGQEVLTHEYSRDSFRAKVQDEFRIFMYLTSEENKLTINYEGTHDEELERLKIQKFPKSANSPFAQKHTLYKNFINWAKHKVSRLSEITSEEAEQLLTEFIQQRNR